MHGLVHFFVLLTIPSVCCWLTGRERAYYKGSAPCMFIPSLLPVLEAPTSPMTTKLAERVFMRMGRGKSEIMRRISLRDSTGSGELKASWFSGTEYQRAKVLIEEVKSIDGVDVFIKLEDLGGNRRRISGGLFIDAPPEAIWGVLTNYTHLSDYIPNIAESGAQLQPNGKIRIEQVGVISQTLNIKTKIVLEVTEEPYRKLTFSKIESREFLEFEGTYSIIQSPDGRAYLEYSVEALPLPILPVFLVQSKILQEVPPMLAAVRTYALRQHQQRQQEAKFAQTRQTTAGLRRAPAAVADERRGTTALSGRSNAGFRASAPPPLNAHSLPSAARSAGGGWAQSWLGSQRRGGGVPPPVTPSRLVSSLPFALMASSMLETAISLRKFLPGIKALPGEQE